jgi:hypothetical protein
MANYSQLQLGRSGIRHDLRRRTAAHKMLASLPPPPAAVDNTCGVTAWGMMSNDQLGDCTIAGIGHSIQVASLNTRSIAATCLAMIRPTRAALKWTCSMGSSAMASLA